MTYADWVQSVDRFLVSRNRGISTSQIDQQSLMDAYRAGMSPLQFAMQPTFMRPRQQPPPPPPDPRSRQSPAVLNDPRYQVDTGFGISCPACGSTNILAMGKPGTGLGYFGSLGWVVGASIVEGMIQNAQKQPFQCGYCTTQFVP